ncbi:hypothetical protein ACHAWF_017071 [Thalassiosira exigua]
MMLWLWWLRERDNMDMAPSKHRRAAAAAACTAAAALLAFAPEVFVEVVKAGVDRVPSSAANGRGGRSDAPDRAPGRRGRRRRRMRREHLSPVGIYGDPRAVSPRFPAPPTEAKLAEAGGGDGPGAATTPPDAPLYFNLSCPFEWAKYSCAYMQRGTRDAESVRTSTDHYIRNLPGIGGHGRRRWRDRRKESRTEASEARDPGGSSSRATR